MPTLGHFCLIVSQTVEEIFVSFRKDKYEDVGNKLHELHNYLKENYSKTPLHESCSFFPYRTIPTAMKEETIMELIKLFSEFGGDYYNQKGKEKFSEHLWRLLDGWNEDISARLALARLGIKLEIVFGSIKN